MLLKKRERLPSVDASCGFDSSDAIVGGADQVRPDDLRETNHKIRRTKKTKKTMNWAEANFQKREIETHDDHYHFAEPHM